MSLTRDELNARIDAMHLDELPLVITRDGGGGFDANNRHVTGIADLGSSYEIPDDADEHGKRAFACQGFTCFQYHASYVAPRPDNHSAAIDELAAGHSSAVIVDCTGLEETWAFGIRSET